MSTSEVDMINSYCDDWEMEAAALIGGNKCISCDNEIFVDSSTYPRYSGQIYSQSGVDEFHISGLCEYCYDHITIGG